MQAKASGRQTLFVLIAVFTLITFFTGGLWAYVVSADAETGIQETAEAALPRESTIAITWEKYDNYPSDATEEDLEFWFQGFGLTREEKERLITLQAAYASGTRPVGKAPSMPLQTGFAIVALDPAHYAGMEEYYFLPGERLSEEQLLQLIEYSENKGLPFTQDTLTVKNCMRGGAVEANRFRSAGENLRREALSKRIMEEGLRPETPGPAETVQPISGVADIPLNPDMNSGLDSFRFYPIRELTDEEIISELFLRSGTNAYLDPTSDESLNPTRDILKARRTLEDVLFMPLSSYKDTFHYSVEEGTGAKLFQITFKTPKVNGREAMYWLTMEMQSGQCRKIFVTMMDDSLYYYENGTLFYGRAPDLAKQHAVDLSDQRCAQSALEAVKKLTQAEVKSLKSLTEVSIGNTYDQGMYVAVQMADGTAYLAAIRYEDAVVTGIDYLPDGLEKWLKDSGMTNIG